MIAASLTDKKFVRSQVLTAAGVKMAVFWVAVPCSLVWKFVDVSELLFSVIRSRR
jgi:hypothetical protein